jgi:hypothetical protein
MDLNELINKALNEVRSKTASTEKTEDPVKVFAKSAAAGYVDWLKQKVATDVEQGSNEAVSGSPYLEATEDPATHSESVVDEMQAEAAKALSEQGATFTEEGAPQFQGEDRVADLETAFTNAFVEELKKLAAEGAVTTEAVVNDAANTATVQSAIEEKASPEEGLAEEIAEEVARREAPGYAGTSELHAR